MRQRFTFGRNRASTLNSSTTSISNSGSRPRSATTPVSLKAKPTWDMDSRCYNFTDEPGYFRPVSPLLERQEVEEDLEDELVHACSLLVQSIDRGLPIWPSFLPDSQSRQAGGTAPSPQAYTNPQGRHPSPARVLDTGIPVQKGNPDSGVAFSNPSPRFYGRTGSNSLSTANSCAGNGRFYGKRLSTSLPEDEEVRGRSRGRSSATDSTSPCSRSPRSRSTSCSRSRSPSLVLFPYSPPQADAPWTHEDAYEMSTKPTIQPFTERDSPLGPEGMTWLRASLDIQPRVDHDTPINPSTNKKANQPAPAAPRRFYSMRQPSKKKLNTPDWTAYEVTSSRNSSIRGSFSVHSFSSFDEDEGEKSYHNFYQLCADPARETTSNAVPRTHDLYTPPRHKRKRASHLLKKLTGLGMRRREPSMEGRRVHTAVAALA
ncbi:hypothetical protein N7532_006839 [Penicillium argentinense]|uniref:Uncharacterized protein n=1 Tax=Penicillium argentinense TaxID=1131581 RepID=A0A9W9KBA6_9EURO|nr:uncharacterized protein N7532_006839 [Penicillium argentinense]KAJ5099838.1 hypothetical protein N7532_006839 [Penicillium argentinense]